MQLSPVLAVKVTIPVGTPPFPLTVALATTVAPIFAGFGLMAAAVALAANSAVVVLLAVPAV